MKVRNMTLEIIKKEIRDVIRDKKIILMMLVMSVLLGPGAIYMYLSNLEENLQVDIINNNTIGFAFELDSTMEVIAQEVGIQKISGTEKELKTKLEEKKIDAYISFENNTFKIYYVKESGKSQKALELVYTLLENYVRLMQNQILTSNGLLQEEVFNIYEVEVENISDGHAYVVLIMSVVTMMTIMIFSLFAVYPAIDITAGEKERGTLETLFTFPINKSSIIMGKFIATSLCSLLPGVLSFGLMYIVLWIFSGRIEYFGEMQLLNASSICLLLLLFIMLSMLASAIAMASASGAKSFKEAEYSTMPVAFLGILPMYVQTLGVELNLITSFIPFVNIGLLMEQIFFGSVNILYFIIMVISTIVVIIIMLKFVAKLYKSERILFS